MLYERPIDREREFKAMLVMQKHLCMEMVWSEKKRHIDFYTLEPGYVCEHKWRKCTVETAKRWGGIYLEIQKHKMLSEEAIKRSSTPLFVITLMGDPQYCPVFYADVTDITGMEVEVARRNNYRCEHDADACYLMPMRNFRFAGVTTPTL